MNLYQTKVNDLIKEYNETNDEGCMLAIGSIILSSSNDYEWRSFPKRAEEVNIFFDGNGSKEYGLGQFRAYWNNGISEAGSIEIKDATNNILEYNGLIIALEYLVQKLEGHEVVKVFGDSKLVINQVNEQWRVKELHLVPLRDKVFNLLSQVRQKCKSIEINWVSNKENLVDKHV